MAEDTAAAPGTAQVFSPSLLQNVPQDLAVTDIRADQRIVIGGHNNVCAADDNGAIPLHIVPVYQGIDGVVNGPGVLGIGAIVSQDDPCLVHAACGSKVCMRAVRIDQADSIYFLLERHSIQNGVHIQPGQKLPGIQRRGGILPGHFPLPIQQKHPVQHALVRAVLQGLPVFRTRFLQPHLDHRNAFRHAEQTLCLRCQIVELAGVALALYIFYSGTQTAFRLDHIGPCGVEKHPSQQRHTEGNFQDPELSAAQQFFIRFHRVLPNTCLCPGSILR